VQLRGDNSVNYINNGNNLAIGTTTASERLSVNGRISLTTDPNSDDDVGDRGYNDSRYINVGEGISGDLITDNTIDGSELEDTLDIDTVNGIARLDGNYGNIVRSYDEWLRLNAGGGHTNGVYTENLMRADG